eukprot:TRINITY_DN24134_c0_g1_i2.p1 TRINITY_DN24134_c0_g1~~TRINITY_DN24134_c0_g1_i2.p1  ORF type:complete len:257 (+),score=26.94 TRINITY_DN24134_c0_g1_i2:3-773(+)
MHHLRHDPPRALYHLKSEDIMSSVLTVLPTRPTLRQVMDVLRNSRHNGYPVVSGKIRTSRGFDPSERYGKLEGLILRHQLVVLVEEAFYCDVDGVMLHEDHRENYWKHGRMLDYLMRHYFFKGHQEDRVRIPYKIQAADPQIINQDRTYIDLGLFMHRRPVCIAEGSYASNAHKQFVALRLRHMPVVDRKFNLVGLITRKDLDKAAGHGHWRHNPAPNISPASSFEVGVHSSTSFLSEEENVGVGINGESSNHPKS